MKRYELRITPQGNGGAMIPDETGGWVMHHSVKELETLVAQQAAVIEQWHKAYEGIFAHCLSNGVFNAWGKPLDCTLLNEASFLQPCPEVLNKERADAVREAASKFEFGVRPRLLEIAQRIEQGEA